jgi:hypothetical protein
MFDRLPAVADSQPLGRLKREEIEPLQLSCTENLTVKGRRAGFRKQLTARKT